MDLNREERKILKGVYGEAAAEAMRILVKIGEVEGAPRLVDVSHAHISGISYKNIGEAGLAFLEELAEKGSSFQVYTTINPAGMDLTSWKEMGIDESFAERQFKVINALERMGGEKTLSCTPYHFNPPRFGDRLAWAESNAVLYANSVYGARTNREGGPMAILEAIVGKTPLTGLHLEENRKPTHVVDFSSLDEEEALASSLLGYYVGLKVDSGVPYIKGLRTSEKGGTLKLFFSAAGAAGSLGLILIEGLSPEARLYNESHLESLKWMTPSKEDVLRVKSRISSRLGNFEAVALGCPHLNSSEMKEILSFIGEKDLDQRLILFTSRQAASQNRSIIEKLREKGSEVYFDTCMVVAPLRLMGVERVVVDSAKAAHYLLSQGHEVTLLSRRQALDLVKI